MNPIVHGIYETPQTALDHIEKLKNQGTPSKDIVVVLSDDKMHALLSDQTDVSIQLATPEEPKHEDEGFVDNLKNVLAGTPGKYEKQGYIKDVLLNNGLSEEKALSYTEEVAQDQILVLKYPSSL